MQYYRQAAKGIGNDKPDELKAAERLMWRVFTDVAFRGYTPLSAAKKMMDDMDWSSIESSQAATWFHTGEYTPHVTSPEVHASLVSDNTSITSLFDWVASRDVPVEWTSAPLNGNGMLIVGHAVCALYLTLP